MANKNSFIFLPDISGFTEFVSHTEVEHSQHIIAELLELLIDSQDLGMTLAEIEGDALFYYKNESVPQPAELMAQVEKMYVAFHSHLKLYEKRRICNCGACSTANELTLKFIAHAGPLDFIQIKDQRKPYGKEVITAHRLMKNTVPIDDYLLLSEGVYNSWTSSIQSDLPQKESQSEYDLGVVHYKYFELIPLQEKAKLPSLAVAEERNSRILASETILIDQDREKLFEYISNFKYRLKWTPGIDKLDYEENRVNRLGTKHQCVVDGRLIDIETVAKEDQEPEELIYGERTEGIPLVKPFTTFFTIKKEANQSRVIVEGRTESKSLLSRLLSPLIRIKIRQQMRSVLKNLKKYAESEAL